MPGAAFARGAASAACAAEPPARKASAGLPPGFQSCSPAEPPAGGAGGLGFPTGLAAGGDSMAMAAMARM
eukprot:10576123-Heterocapsa_arctica.AAC.1